MFWATEQGKAEASVFIQCSKIYVQSRKTRKDEVLKKRLNLLHIKVGEVFFLSLYINVAFKHVAAVMKSTRLVGDSPKTMCLWAENRCMLV